MSCELRTKTLAANRRSATGTVTGTVVAVGSAAVAAPAAGAGLPAVKEARKPQLNSQWYPRLPSLRGT